MEEVKSQDKYIMVGVREDNSLYFDVSPGVSPHEAVGMVRWLQLAVESNIEQQHMIGAGGVLEAIKNVTSEVRSFQSAVQSSQNRLLSSIKTSLETTAGVINMLRGTAKEE